MEKFEIMYFVHLGTLYMMMMKHRETVLSLFKSNQKLLFGARY